MNQSLGDGYTTCIVVVISYFIIANIFWTALMIGSARESLRDRRRGVKEDLRWQLGSSVLPKVSVLMPAYNEAETVAHSVRALLTLQYPALEVVLVNDGSKDETLARLIEEFELRSIYLIYRHVLETKTVRALYRSRLYPGLIVVDKDNGGKADSLNAALNLATGELVCAIDADTIIEPGALLHIVQPFLGADDIVASGGTIRIANGSTVEAGRVTRARVPRRFLPGVQAVEYLRSFLIGRLGWNQMGGNLIISGAFGLFRRDALRSIGGYEIESIGEDMELVVRLRRYGIEHAGPSNVVFIPDPVAWTEAPESIQTLARQRDRWQRGLADVLWRHRRLAFNPRYGAVGLVSFPYFIMVELFGPVVEIVGLLGLAVGLALGLVNGDFAVAFALAIYGWGLLFNVGSLVLDEFGNRRYEQVIDRVLLITWALLEQFGYRQLTGLWQLRGMLRALRGRREWGDMARKGFREAPAPKSHEVI